MPGRQDNYSASIPMSPPPPQNLSSYSRFMHDHTKRQMEASGAILSGPSIGHTAPASGASSMTNGTSPSDYHG
jgi:hypothetical protein